ncbi:MAG TPA: lactate racemase domain-containing protein [Bacillota bacterium]|nr:DUF2088 domain-containing protein [Bacillota bacterium]HOA16156.1 lactate racemase domain-containing protein [Bacillota bacterium]HOG53262.1 lactate racemase domain-containing protein [Bacillota bacterium]
MLLPRMVRVSQDFPSRALPDVGASVRAALSGAGLNSSVVKGGRYAITAGSRGIANIAVIIRAIADAVKEAGGTPFVVPAMGSHGGATAEGQRQMIEGFGITEGFVGAPILSSMEVVEVARTESGVTCYMDRNAYEADGVILCGRIKPHTDFKAPVESGLLKMLVIGLGKHAQAQTIHSYGSRGLRELIPAVAEKLLATGKVIGGLAIVEDAYDKTALVEWLRPEAMYTREQELLKVASKEMARLPLDDIDLLIVDRIGKNISGTGMDTNVIGRLMIKGEPDPGKPSIKYIAALSLTEESHGNALGIGLADVTTKRLADAIDFKAMNENVITTSFLGRGSLPVVLATDKEAVETALKCLWGVKPEEAKVVRITDTAHLSELLVSEAALPMLPPHARPVGQPHELAFDEDGSIAPFERY